MAAIHAFVGGGENGYGANLVNGASGAYTYGTGWVYDGLNVEIDYTTGGGSLRQSITGDPGTYLISYEISQGGGSTYLYLDQTSGAVSIGPHAAPGGYSLEVAALNPLLQVRVVSSSPVSVRPNISVQRKY